MPDAIDHPQSARLRRSAFAFIAALMCTWILAAPAHAQLRPEQVLVVYDSRIANSLAVAEYYAGSAAVPGGVGGKPGTRPGVRVFNLASAGVAAVNASPNTFPTIAYPDFITLLRNPLRTFLTANNLTYKIRCIVLTMGMPHRLSDMTTPGAGDNGQNAYNLQIVGQYTAASVDSELTLLWQNLSDGFTAGTPGSALACGYIVNPYFKQTIGINAWSTQYINRIKSFTQLYDPAGFGTTATGNTDPALNLAPGDFYMVCRIDAWGNTPVANAEAMLDRSVSFAYNTTTADFVMDESDSNGLADAVPNNEYDNDSATDETDPLYAGDDYERARDLLTSDRRFATAIAGAFNGSSYNRLPGLSQFIVGPNNSFIISSGGMVKSNPIVLLSTYGSNHNGNAGTAYTWTFNYAAGCIFNTLESFNGRVFGGLGQSSPNQAQISDFLLFGGTFGLAHVWEPFTLTVGKNRLLASNFILGNLTWAEAAYSAIPALSCQTIVLGDPLATSRRSCEDINADGRITIDDLYAWYANQANVALTDLNRSGTVTSADRVFVEKAVRRDEGITMATPAAVVDPRLRTTPAPPLRISPIQALSPVSTRRDK